MTATLTSTTTPPGTRRTGWLLALSPVAFVAVVGTVAATTDGPMADMTTGELAASGMWLAFHLAYAARQSTIGRPRSTTPRTLTEDLMNPRQLVERYLEILDTGRYDLLDEILAPDVYDHVGQRAGIGWWQEILGKVGNGFSDTSTTVHHILVDGDHVAAHWTVQGHHTGPFLPQVGAVEPTGKPFAWTHVHIFRVADGLIAEHWAVRDDLGLAKQVGALGRPT